jgi:hypothetical protein
MVKTPIRLLVNAEPFGFGPTAAIAALEPLLREIFAEIAYIGSGHTLDLQRQLPYSAVYDQSKLTAAQQEAVLKRYDVMLTASDFDMARAAQAAGLKLCIYDPLAWYWDKFPRIAKAADLYIAQNFFGVQLRLLKEFNDQAKFTLVSPIVTEAKASQPREGILINLGGLQNPHWPLEQAVSYARTLLKCLRQIIPADEKVIIATSRAIAQQLDDPEVRTYSVEQMRALRQSCRLAFMTPGLGNIFDSAADDIPTVWLPPANDSQGQQAKLLQSVCRAAKVIDWGHLQPQASINYRAAQSAVLAQIDELVTQFAADRTMQENFCYYAKLGLNDKVCTTRMLLVLFGQNGAKQVAEAVTRYCASLSKAEAPHA